MKEIRPVRLTEIAERVSNESRVHIAYFDELTSTAVKNKAIEDINEALRKDSHFVVIVIEPSGS
jgi:hypothetical protein